MRRLTLQFSLEEVSRIQGESIPENLKSLEVLHILKQDRREFAAICRATPKDPGRSIDLFQNEADEGKLLERGKDGVCTYFVRSKMRAGSLDSAILSEKRGYLVEPFEVNDGKATITFVGDSSQVKKFLRNMEKTGIPYKLVALTDARFSSKSPLARLTEKQRRALLTAFNLGYYELPKRISSRELGEKLHMRSSTFVTHRIKAERKIIAEVVGGVLGN